MHCDTHVYNSPQTSNELPTGLTVTDIDLNYTDNYITVVIFNCKANFSFDTVPVTGLYDYANPLHVKQHWPLPLLVGFVAQDPGEVFLP